jgi:hypothetical protein
MKELQLVLSDDLTFATTGERVPAEETVLISLDGKTRELDLTAEHAAELRQIMEPYLKAGHAPGNEPPLTSPEGKRIKKPTPSLIEARAAQKKIRDWADARGMRSPDGKRPVYRTESGGYYYSYQLLKEYERWLEEETKFRGPGASHG